MEYRKKSERGIEKQGSLAIQKSTDEAARALQITLSLVKESNNKAGEGGLVPRVPAQLRNVMMEGV